MKICKACKKELPLDQFYDDRANKDKKRGRCKPCYLKQTSLWQKFNPDRCKAKNYKYRAKKYKPLD